ncbi:conserved exported hypothetical protein [Verrucomicrobia bacterium]|nr:conserved exported hypothetical protein [Verrucomicrobiota bacterium]
MRCLFSAKMQAVLQEAARFAAGLLLAGVVLWMRTAALAATNFYYLAPSEAPTTNPLKGFMPYAGSYTTFPYSMEWSYLPLRSLMTGPTNFDWSSLDSLLSSVAGRGHHTVFRVYLDYPTLPTGIPQYLLDAGLVTYSYNDYGNNGVSVCPDYENPLLDQALTNFIAALGARYDGDSRIGFITVGLLGFWGEWHTYPHTNWFASASVQDAVLSAYGAAFTKTKLLVRWPAGTNPGARQIGYHDDSFADDTIDPPSWKFLGLLKAAGETNKWITQPIGGEVYPPLQPCLWDTTQTNCVAPDQAYTTCVALTHATWMLNQGVFSPGFTGQQQASALAGSRMLGYALYISNAILVDAPLSGPLNASVELWNTGVAPFYYDWPVQLGALNGSNILANTWTTTCRLSSVLPAVTNTTWSWTQINHGLAAGQYKLLLRAQNPLTNGVPFRFANAAQDADLTGWVTLGQFAVTSAPAQPSLSCSYSPPDFDVLINAAPGRWRVEGTSDLVTWTPLLTTNTTTSRWSVTYSTSSTVRFYRVVGSP